MALAAKVVHLSEHKERHMGNPQTEDGYTRIANELLDAILLRDFSGRQIKVLMAIIRKTYGFNKKSDEIGLSQFRDITGIDSKHVSVVLHDLEQFNVIAVSHGDHARRISLNKNYKTWNVPEKASPKKGVSLKEGVSIKEGTGYPQNGCFGIPNLGTTKDKPKDNQKTVNPAAEKSASVLLKTWLSAMAEKGEKAISPDDTVFEYAEQAGISDDMMRICWLEFRARNLADNKRKKDWRAHFRNAVRGNWYRLWAFDGEGKAFLTSQGRQAMNVFKGE